MMVLMVASDLMLALMVAVDMTMVLTPPPPMTEVDLTTVLMVLPHQLEFVQLAYVARQPDTVVTPNYIAEKAANRVMERLAGFVDQFIAEDILRARELLGDGHPIIRKIIPEIVHIVIKTLETGPNFLGTGSRPQTFHLNTTQSPDYRRCPVGNSHSPLVEGKPFFVPAGSLFLQVS
jgi:hypothetical protein